MLIIPKLSSWWRFDSLRISSRSLDILAKGPPVCGDLAMALAQAGPQFTQVISFVLLLLPSVMVLMRCNIHTGFALYVCNQSSSIFYSPFCFEGWVSTVKGLSTMSSHFPVVLSLPPPGIFMYQVCTFLVHHFWVLMDVENVVLFFLPLFLVSEELFCWSIDLIYWMDLYLALHSQRRCCNYDLHMLSVLLCSLTHDSLVMVSVLLVILTSISFKTLFPSPKRICKNQVLKDTWKWMYVTPRMVMPLDSIW